MATTAEHLETWPTAGFRHEALLYAGDDGFVDGTLPWLREAVAAQEPALVVVSAARIARLRDELGADAEDVTFADMAEVGINPARIIPAWREFVDAHADAAAGCGASASRSGPTAAPTSSSSASATRRCSTWPSPAPRTSGCCARTTSRLSAPTSSRRPTTAIPPWSPTARRRSSATYQDLPEIAGPFAEPLPDPPAGAERACLRPGDIGQRARAGHAASAGRRLLGGAHGRPRARRQRGGDQLDPSRRRRGRAAHLAERPRADLRGRRRRPDRRPACRAPAARSAASPAVTACGCATRSATWSSCAPSPPAASCGCTPASVARRSPRAAARGAAGRRSRRCGRTAS